MHTAVKIGIVGVLGLGLYEGIVQLSECSERHTYWQMARKYCDAVGKPLLRIGMRRSSLEPPNGDLTLDIDPDVLKLPGGILGDERFMPLEDQEVGVCFNEHTLEHLNTAEDVEMAVNECRRVADYAILLAPSPYSIQATLFCPSHRLRLWFDNRNDKIIVRPNNWRTGLGRSFEGDTGGIKLRQAMVLQYDQINIPAVIQG